VILASIACGVFIGLTSAGHISGAESFFYITGLCLILLGLIIRWIAILTLRHYFTVDVAIVRDHKIIQRGMYGVIRHPSYLGSLISFLGLGLSFSNWISLTVIFIPITAAFLNRIKIEEAALTAAFGDEYTSYSATTNSLLPKIY
jgi:protein-S-isoprenylcysteine O-methyltransferase Ste14